MSASVVAAGNATPALDLGEQVQPLNRMLQAANAVMAGSEDLVIAGGTEMMSMARCRSEGPMIRATSRHLHSARHMRYSMWGPTVGEELLWLTWSLGRTLISRSTN